MRITKIVINDVRSFRGFNYIEFSTGINIFVGKNNSGKSTILRCIHLIQRGSSDLEYLKTFTRKFGSHTNQASVEIFFDSLDSRSNPLFVPYSYDGCMPFIGFTITNGNVQQYVRIKTTGSQSHAQTNYISSQEPDNFLILYFTKRKSVLFEKKTDVTSSYTISDSFKNLYARIAKLSNPAHDAHGHYIEYVQNILGCKITAMPANDGSEAGLWLNDSTHIPITAMGEGTTNILGMIVELCIASNKAFLIEELENDIHPEALKALLELIREKSQDNQFFISTHSNIVLSHLGAVTGSKIFSLEMNYVNKIPTSKIEEIGDDVSMRHEVLSRLGYEFIDFGLWQGYLILEESTAESVINQILIPLFVPTLLGKLRTIAANGVTKVMPLYDDFHRLFVFTHTSPIYSKSSWVRIDNGEAGQRIIELLRTKFSKTPPDRFSCYNSNEFESYYPAQFQDEAKIALAAKDHEKKNLKTLLCKKVLNWASKNKEEATAEFAISAREIIDDLKSIDSIMYQ